LLSASKDAKSNNTHEKKKKLKRKKKKKKKEEVEDLLVPPAEEVEATGGGRRGFWLFLLDQQECLFGLTGWLVAPVSLVVHDFTLILNQFNSI